MSSDSPSSFNQCKTYHLIRSLLWKKSFLGFGERSSYCLPGRCAGPFLRNSGWQSIKWSLGEKAKRVMSSTLLCPLQQRLSNQVYTTYTSGPILFTGLTILSFYLPPDSGERISLVITNLLAMTVFMLLVADIIPPTSDAVSIISTFYSCCIFEVCFYLVFRF